MIGALIVAGLAVFGVGFCIGCVVAAVVLARRSERAERGPLDENRDWDEGDATPGLLENKIKL